MAKYRLPLFVFGGIALFVLGYLFVSIDPFYLRNIKLFATFSDWRELKEGALVNVDGLTVGKVKSITVLDAKADSALIEMKITKQAQIPKSAVAKIISSDLMGTKVITIHYDSLYNFCVTGDRIATTKPQADPTLDDIFKKLIGSFYSHPTQADKDSMLQDTIHVLVQKLLKKKH